MCVIGKGGKSYKVLTAVSQGENHLCLRTHLIWVCLVMKMRPTGHSFTGVGVKQKELFLYIIGEKDVSEVAQEERDAGRGPMNWR